RGPRYRLGWRDLAALARHVRALRQATAGGHPTADGQATADGHATADGQATAGDPPTADRRPTAGRTPTADRCSLFDAISDIDVVADLSAIGRSRLAHFRREYEALWRASGCLPVVDLAETIAARTGLWAVAGVRGRDNLLRFLALAEDFTPI